MSNKIELGHKAEGRQITLEIRENDDKLRAFIKESVDGKALPMRMAFLDVVGQGADGFMVLRAPLRVKDEAGEYVTRARQKDGKFLDEKGAEVASEDLAAREYVYMTQKNEPEKLVYAQVGTLNVKNTKADSTPTAMTLISAKLYSDDEALTAERLAYKMAAVGKDHADYAGVLETLKTTRKETGTWHNFFINSGAELLRSKGFEVRERAKTVDASPAP